MHRLFQRSVFVLSLGLLVALIAGEFGLHAVRADSNDDGAYKQMNVYQQVLKHIQAEYVTAPNMNDVTTGALHGLLESLDADSSYMTPAEYKIYKDHPVGADAQVGLTVSKRFGYAVIVSVLPGSPAEKEQLTDGDAIESIDGQSTRELSLAMIRAMLEGKPGSEVVLSVIRPRKPDPDKLTLARTVPSIPALAEDQFENGSIVYLKPIVLTQARVDQIAAQLKTAGKDNKKILLDLRDVSQGDEAQGERLANFFLKQGTIATLSGQKFPTQTFTADPSKFITAAPMAVLVNRGTSGAAELAAAALEDNKRADVVGERTFGEGSVQKTLELPDGAAVILTVATYSSPSGKKFLDDAVTPNVPAGLTPEQQAEEEETGAEPKGDPALDKALSILKAKTA
ncbi:S41 family peptidase [Acidicapsa dinghuensis]|uniref:S41 family peptidase n=1 Tax=Acidicapsa dinghuensis TaxID=2218256 RepID=A0ABW1EE30_9BACT|nr:S41 family peptidase [Acidicapsa dinghuensis]